MRYIKKFEALYYSDKVRKTIDDILVELKDNGFTYFFNDIRGGLSIKIENPNIYFNLESDLDKEIFLMLEDYMRLEWGDVDISYEYAIIRRGSGNITKFGHTSSTKIKTITDILEKDLLVYIKFFCSRK
jgi:hypothetical protein